MIEFRSGLAAILKGLALAGIALICIGIIVAAVFLLSSRELHWRVASAIGLRDTAKDIRESLAPRPPINAEETGFGEAVDRYSIVRRVLECTGLDSLDSLVKVPVNVRLLYTENPRFLELDPKPSAPPDDIRRPTQQERAVMELSRSLFNQRLELREKVEAAYKFWQITALITIALGLLTTVLVSLSSSEFGKGDGRIPVTIRILAIFFPALGTAAAAVVAFYGPQTEWTQASHSLASYSQLHNQMAVAFWKIDCPKWKKGEDIGKDAALDKLIEAWAGRYQDIQTLANGPAETNGEKEKKAR